MSLLCAAPVVGRRRIFWSTQPDACGVRPGCVSECGSAGLTLVLPGDDARLVDPCSKARSIATSEYVRGLALNMLLTDARKHDTECGYLPGAINGHWSETYMSNGKPVGTSLRYLATVSSILDAVAIIKVYAAETLNKLVDYGVASRVDVTASYKGRNQITLDVLITGTDGLTSRVGLSGTRLENSWAWN